MNRFKMFFYIMIAITLMAQASYITIYSPREVETEKDITAEFHKGIAEIVVKDQKRELTIKDETIGQLETAVFDLQYDDEFNEMAYEDTIKMLEYCLLYIQMMQVRMAQNGVDYPAFILDSVLIQIMEEGIEDE